MTKNRKATQLTLLFIGVFLILATYFFYPKFTKDNITSKKIIEESTIGKKDEVGSRFENVEYTGIYGLNNNFKIKSTDAYISEDEPDIVLMNDMKVLIHMKDGRIISITSDRGKYNKATYDCFFIDNVKATDEETLIVADNIDLLATPDMARVYNNVLLTNDSGSLKADEVKYDFEKRYYHISMFDQKKVKVKLIK